MDLPTKSEWRELLPYLTEPERVEMDRLLQARDDERTIHGVEYTDKRYAASRFIPRRAAEEYLAKDMNIGCFFPAAVPGNQNITCRVESGFV